MCEPIIGIAFSYQTVCGLGKPKAVWLLKADGGPMTMVIGPPSIVFHYDKGHVGWTSISKLET